MKGRNICLQSRKHQKKHTRIISYLQLWTNSPCLFDKPPNFRVTAFLGKKQPAQFLPRTGGKQFSSPGDELLGLWRWVFRFFPTIVSRRANEKSGVEAEMGHNKYGRMFKWCSPTIEWFKCWIEMMFANYWVFTNPFFFPGLDFTWNLGRARHFRGYWDPSLGFVMGCGIFVPWCSVSRSFCFGWDMFGWISGQFWMIFGKSTWTLVGGWNWHDMILIFERWQGWFCWEIRGVRCVRTRGDYHRFSEDISDSRFRDIFRSIDDGFKFWTPKIFSSRAQE